MRWFRQIVPPAMSALSRYQAFAPCAARTTVIKADVNAPEKMAELQIGKFAMLRRVDLRCTRMLHVAVGHRNGRRLTSGGINPPYVAR